jgi:hypothetical protein
MSGEITTRSKLPAVIAAARAHAKALAAPMLGVRMVGDPRFDYAERRCIADLMTRRAVQYATAMLRRQGVLAGDLRDVDAIFEPPATVTFVRADAQQAPIARFTVPDHVMQFNPFLPAIEASA